MSGDITRRVRALETRRLQASGWSYHALSSDEIDAMIAFHLCKLAGGVLSEQEAARFRELDARIERRGPPPFADLSEQELDRRIAGMARSVPVPPTTVEIRRDRTTLPNLRPEKGTRP